VAAAREDALLLLEESASAILQSLEPSERSRLLRRMAHALRRSQVRRITAQKGPDGMPWPKRKPRKERQAVSRPIRFLYNKGGQTRVAEMRSWRKDGATITGFDREADDIRTFRRDRIARFFPPQGGTVDPGALDGSLWNEKGKLKVVARKMFLKLKTGSHLTARAEAGEAWGSALLGLFRAVGRDLVDQAFHARVRCIHLRLDLLGLTLGFFHGLVPFMCPARLTDRGSANEAELSRCGISPSKAMKKALARDRGFQLASLLSDALLQQRGIA